MSEVMTSALYQAKCEIEQAEKKFNETGTLSHLDTFLLFKAIFTWMENIEKSILES